MDTIREICALEISGREILVSCSDDSVLRATLTKQLSDMPRNFESLSHSTSAREDAFPINSTSSLSGRPYCITGGVEGIIKLWRLCLEEDILSMSLIEG